MKRTRQERFRLGVLFVFVCSFFVLASARLGHLQILLHPQYSQIVEDQTSSEVTIPAERGRIYDRNGTIVADNVKVSSLYAYPINNNQLRNVSSYLEQLFNLKNGSAYKIFGLDTLRFRWIKRRIDDDLSRSIEANAPEGIYLRKETQRVYPYGLVGKQVLGFTDIDNHGLAGIEFSYDSTLAGRKGLADIRRDGLRNVFRVNERALIKPKPGISLVLTLDWQLQEIVELELKEGVKRYNAKSGMAVFLNCKNGDILAIAHYDPKEKNRDKPVKLRTVTDQFEPGSVLKPFTAAALLESGLVSPEDTIYCEEGRWKIGRRTLHDDKKHGWLTFAQVIELSSNIGIGKWAIELGGEKLYHLMERFGLGQKLRIGLPGVISGSVVRPQRWSEYNIAALAMGHSVAVTSLQVATGFAAIANGGKLLHPRLILGWVDEKGFVPNNNVNNVIRQVMSETTAGTLRALLRGVVERGTAEPVQSPVIDIAGKTGTAQIPDIKNGGYTNKYVGSFAGFFPCEKPLITGIIVLHEPAPIHYGGWTAGPMFRRIAERYIVLRPDMFNVKSRQLAEYPERVENTVAVPDLFGHDLALAKTIAEQKGLRLRSNVSEGNVIWQFPAADRLAFVNDEVLTVVEEAGKQGLRMIDLTGLSIRQASAFLQFAGITYRTMGNGRVVKQSIRPGERITNETICRLECRPP